MDESSQPRALNDTRRPAHGWGRALVGVFAVFGLVILVPAFITLARAGAGGRLPAALSVLAGLGYLLLSVAVAHNGRRMRRVGWACLLLEALGLLVANLAGFAGTAWSQWGTALWYLPVLLPLVGGIQLWLADPRRIVTNAERITDISDTIQNSVHRDRS
ncbi:MULTISPECIES: hypothetical protein [unclassified Actinomyces]|uniref:hypothetical protein n=1 Tax=unclassified Actinomyces TaxID=2609248 RepID=UPI0013A6A8CC|nr:MULTISPECIES: hypothetical protein [unclassified Actinomyces]MBW3069685.1 hypothetical protein [Actinomyces sp. 594]NDR52832.1 hypothetical protein [Actinomyces sp. 565]